MDGDDVIAQKVTDYSTSNHSPTDIADV